MTAAEAATVEDVTDWDVWQADQQAAEAKALVDAILDRGSAEPGELSAAREVAEFSARNAARTRQAADRAREARRLHALVALRDDIAAHTSTLGDQLAAHLKAAEQALTAAVEVVDQHNTRVHAWYEKAMALDVPRNGGAGLDDTSATVGLPPNGAPISIWAAGRQHSTVDPRGWIGRVLARVRINGYTTALALDQSAYGILSDQVYEDLATLNTREEPA